MVFFNDLSGGLNFYYLVEDYHLVTCTRTLSRHYLRTEGGSHRLPFGKLCRVNSTPFQLLVDVRVPEARSRRATPSSLELKRIPRETEKKKKRRDFYAIFPRLSIFFAKRSLLKYVLVVVKIQPSKLVYLVLKKNTHTFRNFVDAI